MIAIRDRDRNRDPDRGILCASRYRLLLWSAPLSNLGFPNLSTSWWFESGAEEMEVSWGASTTSHSAIRGLRVRDA